MGHYSQTKMLIYIHVPFCRSRCNYCAFHSVPLGRGLVPARSPEVRDYVDTLFLEIARQADAYGQIPVESVFFGGGTPSLLPPKIIGAIMERIARGFKLAPKLEVSLEANPESLRAPRAASGYLAAGVNRLSLGIQSLDERLLDLLGRPHKAQDCFNSILAAREAGFANLNLDLIWGLPGQSVRQWLQTLKDVVRLAPEHISTYGLSVESGTALELSIEQGQLSLPPERDQNIMFTEGAAYLEAHGYLHYEISNFARMGFTCRHNLGYWQGEDYLGLGPSATSTIAGQRWTNAASQKVWGARLAGQVPGPEIERLDLTNRALEMIMLRLRTSQGLRLKDYRELTGRDFLRDQQRLVQALHENGLIRLRNGYLRLTRKGMIVSNAIIGNIFERAKKTLQEGPLPEGAEAGDKALAPQAALRLAEAGPEIRPVVFPQA